MITVEKGESREQRLNRLQAVAMILAMNNRRAASPRAWSRKSRYQPHQGPKEMERRRRQIERGMRKASA